MEIMKFNEGHISTNPTKVQKYNVLARANVQQTHTWLDSSLGAAMTYCMSCVPAITTCITCSAPPIRCRCDFRCAVRVCRAFFSCSVYSKDATLVLGTFFELFVFSFRLKVRHLGALLPTTGSYTTE